MSLRKEHKLLVFRNKVKNSDLRKINKAGTGGSFIGRNFMVYTQVSS
jgi:hypothetical protein